MIRHKASTQGASPAPHFHLLLRIPRREQFVARFECEGPGGAGEQRLLGHLGLLYSKAYLSRLKLEIADLRGQGREAEVQRVFDRYKARFCDLSLFVKELKERFSRWFNKKHARRGTLWMERFRSVLVEDGECLRTMAAYIDLNPVRAGLVDRPEDYRWCGYTEALGGSKRMQRGLCRVIGWPIDHWAIRKGNRTQTGAEAYRCLLYEDGIEREAGSRAAQNGGAPRRGIAPEEAREVIARGGKLSHFQLVGCRVRWFSEGVAIGSEAFLRRVVEEGAEGERIRPLPVGGGSGEQAGPWFSLSRLRRQGVG